MTAGIRATVTFDGAVGCPIARHSAAVDGIVDRIATSVSLPGEAGSVTEYLVAEGVTGEDRESEPEIEASPVLSYGSTTLYRVVHDGSAGCPCECLGAFGCPVDRYLADDGDLTLVFHAETFEQLQAVMDAFRERFPSVQVTRLLRSPLDERPRVPVFVDQGRLTARQREVLRTAYEAGYFERPKRANATELADALGISPSTFTEHLVTAQRKLLADVFEGVGPGR
jgi:hypothetical protein